MEQLTNTARRSDAADLLQYGSEVELATLSSLLEGLDETQHTAAQETSYQRQLVQRRLGLATSLFTALRLKHPPTAAHCLRVALGISSWSLALNFSDAQRDLIEIAALLHDIGKMGVPDHVLLKPGRLSAEELLQMERQHHWGREILSSCCGASAFLDVVFYATAWYDGSKQGFDRRRDELPLGSRMIAIVDAFDAMTTDHVYRRAMSRERAIAELFEFAGTQFDAELVHGFGRLLSENKLQFKDHVARRWLQEIQPEAADAQWTYRVPSQTAGAADSDREFHAKLLEAMHDGVIFVDHRLVVLLWNRAAERLTGIAPDSVAGKQWVPSLIQLCDERGRPFTDAECPIVEAMRSGIQAHRRLSMTGRLNRSLAVDLHVAPVLMSGGQLRGAAIILHDASSQSSLEERVQDLHERATRDPLTKIANRAEFDRVLPEFAAAHLEQGSPCSLIICDVDHFKRVNDTHGHQAGDEALIAFAKHLQSHARNTDLVARYGGEEFVVLCADCDNASATRRAEEIRRRLSEMPQPALGHRCITASFGVTEVQAGDTAETFLRRADRALLQAKDSGRNFVVQLGTGIGDRKPESTPRGWFAWLQSPPAESLLERSLITVVPLSVAAEKLRGFVADHHAEIVSIVNNCVVVKIDGQNAPIARRTGDRPVPFLIEMTFHENKSTDQEVGKAAVRTVVKVVVRPRKQRDRRQRDAVQRARQLLVSLKSYLMAHDYTEPDAPGTPEPAPESFLDRAAQVLTHWLQG